MYQYIVGICYQRHHQRRRLHRHHHHNWRHYHWYPRIVIIITIIIDIIITIISAAVVVLFINRDFKIQRRGRQRERQKSNRFCKQNNNFARASRFFAHFFARFCTTKTWKCLILRFIKNVNKFYFSFWIWRWFLGIQLHNFNFAYIWQSKWVRIIVMKT